MQRLIAWTILILAVASVVVAPFVEMNRPQTAGDIDRLLFFPDAYPQGNWSPKGLDVEDVYFRSDDRSQLHGWFCPVDKPVATILFAHGNAGNVASHATLLRYLQQEVGASVFVFDYRGYGKSAGVPTVDGALQDARAARAKLRSIARVADSEMLLMGASVGGAIVTELAAESPPHGLILQSTFSSLRDVASVHYPKQARMVSRTILDSSTRISKYHGSLFISHGVKDYVIPIRLAQKLFHAANEPKRLMTIAEAGHTDWMTDEYLEQLKLFILESSNVGKR